MATKRAGAPSGLEAAKKQLSGRTTPKKTNPEALLSPSPAAAWKKKTGDGLLVSCPSGNVIKIKTPGMEVFLTEGVIPNALIPVIQDMMKQAKAGVEELPEEELVAMLEDRQRLTQIVELANSVTIYCAVEPRVYPVPDNEEERDDELLYVDEMEFNDKMYIFAVATGGVAGYERFRSEQGVDVGTV